MSSKPLGISWELLLETTEMNTPMVYSTIQKALTDFDQWHFEYRTGVEMINWGDKRRRTIPWANILESLDMSPDALDRKALISVLEKDVLEWLETRKAIGMPGVPSLSEADAKKIMQNLHKTFNARNANEMEIGVLAAFYSVETGEEDIEEIKSNIRAVAKMHPESFSVGAGGAPRVRRLVNTKGTSTGMEAFDTSRKQRQESGPRPKGLLRYGEATMQQMEQAGLQTSRLVFDNWVAYCEENNIEEPRMKDLIAFAQTVEDQ